MLRWEHPKRGIILPEVLIPILADSNQLSKFENFVFEEICHFLALRLALGLQVFPISCNFSVKSKILCKIIGTIFNGLTS